VPVRTIKFAAWHALYFDRLRDSEQAALISYQSEFPFSVASKAAEFQKWFAAINTELFWGDCGHGETDFDAVRYVFLNRWLAERFEWRLHGRLTFLDGTLEAETPNGSDPLSEIVAAISGNLLGS
jgi:hypothetical protein